MPTEIEATFINIDKDTMRKKLREVGAELVQPEILMRRVIFDLGPGSFARVRDEGDKITMSYKQVDDLSLSGTKEICVNVSNYEDTINLLKHVGLKAKADQETLRETWELDGAEITLDTWPWLPSYVEIEGKSEGNVKQAAEKLGFKMEDAHYGSVDQVYKIYYNVTSEDINYCPVIKFMKIPEWLAKKRRADVKFGEVDSNGKVHYNIEYGRREEEPYTEA